MDWFLFALSLCVLGFFTGCCCGGTPTCAICSDTFDRSDGTDIVTGSACDWAEDTGSWAIASNKLSTSSSDAQAVVGVVHPFNRANVIMSATISGSASTDTLRLICGRTGANDYYCAEWTFHATSGSRSHKLRQCVGGSFTDLASENLTTLSVGASIAAELCFGGDKFTSGNLKISLATPDVSSGPYDTALGTGTLAGTATFDTFVVTQEGNLDDLGCEECPIECCCGNDMGDEWIVDLGAGGWVDESCDQCNEIMGEFTLSYDAVRSAAASACVLSYTAADWCYDQEAIDNECSVVDFNIPLIITFTMPAAGFGATCTPRVAISLGNYRGSDTDDCYARSTAEYELTYTKADYDSCQDPDLVPMTLSPGFRGTHNFNVGHTRMCTGLLPATITARPA